MPEPAHAHRLAGLISARRLDTGEAVGSDSIAEALASRAEAPLWLHFDLVDARTRTFLLALDRLPQAARLALLAADRRARIDDADGAVFGTLPDFDAEGEACDARRMGFLHLALVPGLLVTARRHPLRAVARIGAGTGVPVTPAGVLAALVGGVALNFDGAIDDLTERMERIEDALLRGRPEVDRSELASLRHDVLRLHRRLVPLSRLLVVLRGAPPVWIAAADWEALRQAGRNIEGAIHDLNGLQERGRVSQDDLASQIADETNRRLLALSVISAAMLPASLVAGIFGMNTAGLPGTEDPQGFVVAMSLIAAAVLSTLGLLHGLRLL
jgi:zinc transporter